MGGLANVTNTNAKNVIVKLHNVNTEFKNSQLLVHVHPFFDT